MSGPTRPPQSGSQFQSGGAPSKKGQWHLGLRNRLQAVHHLRDRPTHHQLIVLGLAWGASSTRASQRNLGPVPRRYSRLIHLVPRRPMAAQHATRVQLPHTLPPLYHPSLNPFFSQRLRRPDPCLEGAAVLHLSPLPMRPHRRHNPRLYRPHDLTPTRMSPLLLKCCCPRASSRPRLPSHFPCQHLPRTPSANCNLLGVSHVPRFIHRCMYPSQFQI